MQTQHFNNKDELYLVENSSISKAFKIISKNKIETRNKFYKPVLNLNNIIRPFVQSFPLIVDMLASFIGIAPLPYSKVLHRFHLFMQKLIIYINSKSTVKCTHK